jgi:hypothetical protein
LVVALAAVATALALPSPAPSAPTAQPGPAGPVRLADVWPGATPSPLPAGLPDDFSYQPLDILDGGGSVGVATSADLFTVRLVTRTTSGTLRTIQAWSGPRAPTVAATAISGNRVYWLEIGDGPDGFRQTTVWWAGLTAGAPVLLAQSKGDVLYYDTGYDLQIADGHVYWAALSPTNRQRSEIRSVPVDGGPETVRTLDHLYALSAWPWVSTSGASLPGDIELLNLSTGEQRTVSAASNEILACTPIWCRVTTLVNQGQTLRFEVEHPDGQGRRKIGDTGLTPLNTDVALLDRFEVVSSSAGGDGSLQRLWLHDLKDDRVVLLDDSSTATIGSRGPYLWWSTGDNETLSWHTLDLRRLT